MSAEYITSPIDLDIFNTDVSALGQSHVKILEGSENYQFVDLATHLLNSILSSFYSHSLKIICQL